MKFNVRGIPTLILFKNGQGRGPKIGAVRKSDDRRVPDGKLVRGYLGNPGRNGPASAGRGGGGQPDGNRGPRAGRAAAGRFHGGRGPRRHQPAELEASRRSMNLSELKHQPIPQLLKLAAQMGMENLARSRKQDIIFAILKAHARNGESIYGDGVLEILQDGFGFLRSPEGSYLAGPDDIYISPSQIRRFNLRTGDTISGLIRPPKEGERLLSRCSRSARSTSTRRENARSKVLFENLHAAAPDEALPPRARHRQHRGPHRAHDRPESRRSVRASAA